MTEYKNGDKVTFEVTATLSDGEAECLCSGNAARLDVDFFERALQGHGVKVIYHEPVVKSFKPGDRVRSLFAPYEYLVVVNGFVRLDTYVFTEGNVPFTSNFYELVEEE